MVIVWLSDTAQQQLEQMEDDVRDDILTAFNILRNSPLTNEHTAFIEHPEFGDIYRYKVKTGSTDHRIFFTLSTDTEDSEVNVLSILHRDTAYDYDETTS